MIQTKLCSNKSVYINDVYMKGIKEREGGREERRKRRCGMISK